MSDLGRAVQLLAGMCDGALRLDGCGFNRLDTAFGHSLAMQPEAGWSAKQQWAAWNLLRKYREQLKRHGIDYDAIPRPADPGKAPTVATPRATATPPTPTPERPRRIEAFAEGGFLVRFGYLPELNTELGKIVGTRWKQPHKAYHVPGTRENVEGLRAFAVKHGFTWDAEAVAVAETVMGTHEANVEASKAATVAEGARREIAGLGGTLRPFQEAGVEYARRTQRCFVADEMGLGKTIQGLAVLQAEGLFPALVVCPASVKLNWVKEAVTWLPGKRITWMDGGAEQFEVKPGGRAAVRCLSNQVTAADVVILNFDLLKKWQEVLIARPWKALIIDEAHYCKNPKAQRTQYAKSLALGDVKSARPGIPWRLLLTGTPILNRPAELIAPLQILGHLQALGGWSWFTKRYCQAHKDRFGWNLTGAGHLDELNEKLRGLCYIRRLKAEVLGELPEKTWQIVPVELTNRAEYARAEADVIAWLSVQAAQEASFLESVAHLPGDARQEAIKIHSLSAGARAARAEQLVRIGVLKKLAARGKLEAWQEWVGDFLSGGGKLVCFAYHREIQQALLDAHPGAVRIFGEDSASERENAVRAFQEDSTVRLMVASLRAGREGITLTAASDVVFGEQGWTPAEHRQCEDRLHRIGQRDAVTCTYLLAKDTIDEDIRELIEDKRAVVDTLTEGDPALQPEHGILGDLVERLLKKKGGRT